MATPFRSMQRVYFDDLDALGILHNVRYLLFAERARGEWLTQLGFRLLAGTELEPDHAHVVASNHIRYLAPVRGEQDVLVELAPTRLGTSSLVVSARVSSRNGGIVHATSSARLVRVDAQGYRPCPWTERFRAVVEPLVAPPHDVFGDGWVDPAS
jgi:acyl-CoA thioester hydrolase